MESLRPSQQGEEVDVQRRPYTVLQRCPTHGRPAVRQPLQRAVVCSVAVLDVAGGWCGPYDEHRTTEPRQGVSEPLRFLHDRRNVCLGQRRQRTGEVLHGALLRVVEVARDRCDATTGEEVAKAVDRPEVRFDLLRVAQRLPPTRPCGQLDSLEAGDRDRLQRALVVFSPDEVVELRFPLVECVGPPNIGHDPRLPVDLLEDIGGVPARYRRALGVVAAILVGLVVLDGDPAAVRRCPGPQSSWLRSRRSRAACPSRRTTCRSSAP